MEPSTATPAASAQPAAADSPVTQSAVHAAVASGKTSDFRTARRAERSGKPLAPVPVEPAASAQPADTDGPASSAAAAAPAQPAGDPKPSRKEREQQEANERIRKAVDAATADLQAELAALKGQAAPAPAATATPAPVTDTAGYKRFLAMEGAPKLADFDSVEEHSAALSHFIAKTMFAEQQESERHRAADASRAQGLTEQAQRFDSRMKKAVEADPELASKLPPAMTDPKQDSRPLSALTREELATATFRNVAAEAAFRSEQPADFLKYLHAHQDETARIARMPVHDALIALARIDGIVTAAAAATAQPLPKPKPKTLSDAPAPIETLGGRATEVADPKASAVKRGDTRAFREIRRQERAAAMGR